MAHHTLKNGYTGLADRLNRFPLGAPPSELLYKILKLLVREPEAAMVALLPIKPFTVGRAARIWEINEAEARKILEELAGRAILVDIVQNGETRYVLPPPMAGFFEFSMMRVRDDLDQKLLSELFYQYLNVEEDFARHLFCEGETQLGRIFVHEPALPRESALHVLDYERASEIIQTATPMAVGTCYCRHKMGHLGKACAAPQDICMTFNTTADSLIRHGHARRVPRAEGLELLHKAYDNNLVQFGENVREQVNFICNCCSCCCEAMIAARRFAFLQPVHTTNYMPVVDYAQCLGCGKCAGVCPVEALSLSADEKTGDNSTIAVLDEERCLGCGLCVRACPANALRLEPRPERLITPLNSAHRIVVMAIERGTLQHLIFDNRVLWSHRALAAVLGVVLKLPPVKQILASRQLKSRYLETLIRRIDG